MYEPFAATSAPNLKRKKPFTYPGKIPYAGKIEEWNSRRVEQYLQAVIKWANDKGVPSNRMVAGEFGCVRMLNSCETYLKDVLSIFQRSQYHWAFYSFREDSWDAMDYELGTGKVHWSYWDAIEKNLPDPVKRSLTKEFSIIQELL